MSLWKHSMMKLQNNSCDMKIRKSSDLLKNAYDFMPVDGRRLTIEIPYPKDLLQNELDKWNQTNAILKMENATHANDE